MLETLQHYLTLENIAEAAWLLVAIGTFVTRLTKTTADDGFMARVDKFVQGLFDMLHIPNRLK